MMGDMYGMMPKGSEVLVLKVMLRFIAAQMVNITLLHLILTLMKKMLLDTSRIEVMALSLLLSVRCRAKALAVNCNTYSARKTLMLQLVV
jgi:hypothetical protein